MTKPKTLEQLRTEKERAETQLAQEQQAHNIVAVTQLIQHHLTGFTLTGGIGAVAVTEEEGLIE